MGATSIKEIKQRIKSIESTKQITSAMELVASSKLKRARERASACKPFFQLFYNTMQDIIHNNRDFSSAFLVQREVKKTLVIAILGDRGLAGGYNHNVIRLIEENVGNKPVSVLAVGRKALEYFTKQEIGRASCRERV